MGAGEAVHVKEARKHESAAEQKIKGELHRGVLFICRSPNNNEKIHRDHRDFVEQEEKEKICRHKNAEHARDEEKHVRKKILHPVSH